MTTLPRPKLALAIFMGAALAATAVSASAECRLVPIGSGIVTSVQDGRTFVIADGRVVRLLGIEAGNSEALRRQALGKTVRLERIESRDHKAGTDRYGRLVAFAFLREGAEPVQKTLLAEGAARVAAYAGGKPCAEPLLAAEREARATRRGIWADPNFAPLSSENLPGLAAARGHFMLVEGQVLSVRESGATIYVNFGPRWTRDFSVIVPKRRRQTFTAAGVEFDRLRGRRIRVRGIIEQRAGPIIEARTPEQIELID